MKKNLLATSALVAAGALATQGALAEAGPLKVSVGGYYEQWVGYVFQDADSDDRRVHERHGNDLDVNEDGEIHFKGSTTLDNGLTFGMNVQLESATSSDLIDESYIFVRGSFGEIVLGSENGPAYAMHYGADMDQGYGLEEGDSSFFWFSGGMNNQLNTSRPATIDNDSQKIRYISPRFSGFQIGLSYSPEGRQDFDAGPLNENRNEATSTGASGGGAIENIFAGAVNYDGKFDDVRLRASLGGQYAGDVNNTDNGSDNGVNREDIWSIAAGLRLGYGGFDGAIAYRRENGSGPADAKNTNTWTAGIAYTDGPMGVSLTGAYGQTDSINRSNVDQFLLQLGGKYKLGPGVEARATAAYASSSDLTGEGEDYTGFNIVGGIRLVF